MWIVFIAILLIFDAFLHILIVGIKLCNRMVGLILPVIVVNNRLQRLFLFFRLFTVIILLLRQIFLYLLNIFIPFGRRREYASDVKRFVIFILLL